MYSQPPGNFFLVILLCNHHPPANGCMHHHANTDPGYATFIGLFNSYKEPVFAYIRTITGDHHTAEELTQEVFIRLWQKRKQYDEIQQKDQYIFRMAHNACMNWFQKVALDARLAQEVRNRLQTANNNTDDHMAYQEAKALLERALDTLSPQRRKVFELSRREGLRIQEIADQLGISFHTANHHLVAALAQIRTYFLQHHADRALLLLILALIR
jgi:RNA polymerase sigma-70 factor (family 1)